MRRAREPAFVYCAIEAGSEDGPCKIGVATNLSKRRSALQCGNWRKISYAWTIEIPERRTALQIEDHLLSRFRVDIFSLTDKKDLASEWVRASPKNILIVANELLVALELRAAA